MSLSRRRSEACIRRYYPLFSNITKSVCHEFSFEYFKWYQNYCRLRPCFSASMLLVVLVVLLAGISPVAAQIYRPPILGPGAAPPPAARPTPVPRFERRDPPPPGIAVVAGILQDREATKVHLRQKASVETVEYRLEADEIDYDSETGVAEARGAVHFINYTSGEEMFCKRADYNLKDGTGSFYEVHGSYYGKIDPRPGILTTGQPFLFQGDWAEKLKDRYILYKATLTNCDEKDPWWTLSAQKMDIIANDRALAYKSLLRLKKIPLLYTPVFYKDLSSDARHSGFLTPSIGHSNRRGFMVGLGYFWAINRSYDILYRPQYFTTRGLAHTVDFRGKPTAKSDFNFFLYGVNDKGELQQDGTRIKQGGYLMSVTGRTELPSGWQAKVNFNYLSSFKFRQAFTESFNEAVITEANGVGIISRDWSYYHLNTVFTRQENFQSAEPGDTIVIRKLPQVEFNARERQVFANVPLWVSWDTSAGLVRRTQPLFQTRQLVPRVDAEPRVTAAFHWKDLHLIPSFSVRETYYGSRYMEAAPGTDTSSVQTAAVVGDNLNRFTREVSVDLILPTLSRVFEMRHGGKLKHSVETRARFRNTAGVSLNANGVSDFKRVIRFDEMDLVSNTTEVEYSMTNRLWRKKRNGEVSDFLSWELRQKRFLDPTFGGALVPGQRNVFLTTSELTAYAFIDQARNYSPVVSAMRLQPMGGVGLEWRQDYDPLRGRITNSSLTADARVDNYFVSVGHNRVSCVPLVWVDPTMRETFCTSAPSGQLLSPASNQVRGMFGIGQENKRGWNAAFLASYDYTTRIMQYANTQVTYNTACCAFSGQYRRFNFGGRNENQYRVAFVIANIGSFGTLRRQERLF